MKTKTLQLWARPDSGSDKGFTEVLLDPSVYHVTSDEDVNMGDVKVHYDNPPDLSEGQMVLKAIETMKDKQTQILAEAQRRTTQLQAKINNLLMLT